MTRISEHGHIYIINKWQPTKENKKWNNNEEILSCISIQDQKSWTYQKAQCKSDI